ncbi:hypothetical protein KKB40_04690 [Patescibacteria group bacterium]|nr:hypothetical protein [Patescibacteria group bacterium]
MKSFTKNELTGVTIILLAIALATGVNLRLALRRARDAQRRADLGAVSNALHEFFEDFGFFPPAENGKIKACKGTNFDTILAEVTSQEQFDRDRFFEGLVPCRWGNDSLNDLGLFSDEAKTYLKSIPVDPKKNEGGDYIYLSNTKRFQIYSYLEGENSEEGYDMSIVGRDLMCGNKVCSFGKTYTDTPLDKSIEEYELELLEKLKLEQEGAGVL